MTDLLLNTLENIAEHIQRLSINNAKATDDDVTTSAKVSCSCIKAANQAMTMYCTGGSHALKKSMSQRASLHLSVGKLFYWLMEKLPGKPFSESVPVCITAILEQALEELLFRLCIPGREDITHQKFNEITSTHKSLVSCLASMCKQKEVDSAVVLSKVGLLQSINECRAEDVAQYAEFLQWSRQKQRSLVQMSSSGLQCLRYFIGNKQSSTSKGVPIANWTRIMFAFAEHRMSSTVDDVDVQQAARVVLGCDCAPPLITTNIRKYTDLSLAGARKEFAFYLAASGSSNHVHNAAAILAGNWTATNQFGLSLLSEAVIRSDTEALRSLIKVGFSPNVPVPNPSDVRRPFLFSEYTGWTPLTWAVAKRNTSCIELLLHSKVQVENDVMIKESPIQVAAQLGDEDMVRQLLSFDANAFRSTMEYRKTSVRSVGSPSALAAACARGHSRIVDIFIGRC
ncbi:unnamed protein product [Angiostrongylus costaricensis]|uniref:ANK_REP_REGION domain-containing protein n=1 Tax=Angiostrongylus costaricensis TaxID=334426 RepID=A0A0R3PBV0_ANGCS|nr:unnamed protein product [Angiostrongylus costaricensis]